MARKGEKKQWPFVGNPADPQALTPLAEAFVESLRVRHYSKATVWTHERALLYFLEWCDARSLGSAADITRPVLESYQRSLFYYRKKNGQPLSYASQFERLCSVKLFFRWLARAHVIVHNPASEIEFPRVERRLPKHILSAEEVDRVISQPDVSTSIGVRDRAILELLYSTGMRRMELITLKLTELDLERGTVVIRQGKGKKDRMVPVGERAIAWCNRYLVDVRPTLAASPDAGVMFLSHFGVGFTPDFLSRLVKSYIERAGINKTGSCHLFRHAMATQMLDNGADIRFIQTMLGHASLETTQIYTHVAIRKLKEIHSATHPSAKLAPFHSHDDETEI